MSMSMPQEFNWVLERAKCTSSQAFQRLRSQVEADVETCNSLIPENDKGNFWFSFISENDRFSVAIESPGGTTRRIKFSCTAVGVDVYDFTDRLVCRGFLTLSNDCVCKFKVNEIEHDFWQFRKNALEGLFFGERGI